MALLKQTCFLLLACGGMVYGQKADVHKLTPLDADEALSDTARLEWVKHFASNTASSVDLVTDAAMDASGFVFVTGKSEGSEGGRDYLTVKFSPLGQEVWRTQYDGPAHADDIPSALTVDAAGNVYVTGMSMGTDLMGYQTYDYATIKYNSAGQQQWVERYGYVWGGIDRGVAIAVDVNGNVYVTGESSHADSSTYRVLNQDFATIKYNTNGVQQWVRRHNGPKISQDLATALVLDDSGNVYVTGSSEIYSTNPWSWRTAATTLKYNSDGVEQWTASIEQDSTHYSAAGIALDRSGGVYVAGGGGWEFWRGLKLFVARINAAGQEEWVRTHDSLFGIAASLAVDPSGNVLVAGVGGGDSWWLGQGDFMQMMKYNAVGDLLWARQYRDQQNALVKASDMVVDRLGNAYVTGSSGQRCAEPPYMGDSIVTLKYDANGVSQWVEHYSGVAGSKNEASLVLVDVVGNVIVAGASGPEKKSDFLTIKYQPSGNKEWDARVSGDGASFESLTAMTLDATGNVYITGSSIGAGTSSDYITAKFDANGNTLWSARYNSPVNTYDSPTAIVVDSSGNVYVTGSSRRVWSNGAYTTVKYTPQGTQQWAAQYEMPQGWYEDLPYFLSLDCAGNVYVAGQGGAVKYDNSGNQLWAYPHIVYALAVDRQTNVYVSTWTEILKFDSSGTSQQFLSAPATDLAVDDSGNVYITRWGSNPFPDRTQKFSPSGALVWSQNRGGEKIRLDRLGNVFVKRSGLWIDTLAFKISGAGTLEWAARNQGDWLGLMDLSVDGSGNLYLCGPKQSLLPFWEADFFAVKYNPSGIQQWSARYNGQGNSSETPYAMAVDGSGTVYIAGATEREDFSTKITLIKYSQVTVSVNEDQSELPVSYSLSQNYPNPFNPGTTIRFALPKSGHVELKVYTTLGQEVMTLVNEEKVAGTYSSQWNAGSVASGVYFYRLKAGEYTETKKLLLIK